MQNFLLQILSICYNVTRIIIIILHGRITEGPHKGPDILTVVMPQTADSLS